MSEPMVKGAIIRDFVEWFGARQGAEAVRRLGHRLPPHLQAMIDVEAPAFHLLASSWYPAKLVHALFDALAEGRTPDEMQRFIHDANREFLRTGGARKSVYRFFLDKLATPDLYAFFVPRFWKQLHSTGTREVKIVRRGLAESKTRGWAGHGPHLCTMAIETMCTVFEAMGCRDVTWERTLCVSNGDKECKTIVRWT